VPPARSIDVPASRTPLSDQLVEGDVVLLDDQPITGRDDQAVVGRRLGRQRHRRRPRAGSRSASRAARHAGISASRHPGIPSCPELGADIGAPTVARDAQRDVLRPAQNVHLVGEGTIRVGVDGHHHRGGGSTDERERRQGAIADDDRVHKRDGDVLRIRGNGSITEREQSPAADESGQPCRGRPASGSVPARAGRTPGRYTAAGPR